MTSTIIGTPVVNEKIWRAWVEKCELREMAISRELEWAAEAFFGLLVLGSTFYLLAVN